MTFREGQSVQMFKALSSYVLTLILGLSLNMKFSCVPFCSPVTKIALRQIGKSYTFLCELKEFRFILVNTRTVAVEIVRFKFETKIVRCPSDVCKRWPGAVQAYVILPSMTLQNTMCRKLAQ